MWVISIVLLIALPLTFREKTIPEPIIVVPDYYFYHSEQNSTTLLHLNYMEKNITVVFTMPDALNRSIQFFSFEKYNNTMFLMLIFNQTHAFYDTSLAITCFGPMSIIGSASRESYKTPAFDIMGASWFYAFTNFEGNASWDSFWIFPIAKRTIFSFTLIKGAEEN